MQAAAGAVGLAESLRSMPVLDGTLYNPPDSQCAGVSQCSFLQCLGLSWSGLAYSFSNFSKVPVYGANGAPVQAPSPWARFRAAWTENDRWVYMLTVLLSVVVLALLIALIAVLAKPKTCSAADGTVKARAQQIVSQQVPSSSPVQYDIVYA